MLNKEHREFLKSEQGRKWFIEKSLEATPKDSNWQRFHTPYDLCEKMISKTDVTNKSILVLFNIEFLEVLTHKFGVSSKNITFLADCRLESEIAAKIYEINFIKINKNNIWEILKSMKTFDLCFGNPPYTSLIDLEILNNVYKIANEIIIVHPSNWLIERKGVYPLFIETRKMCSNTLKSATLFNGNYVFNIRQYPPCVITHIDKNKNPDDQININYFGQEFKTTDINNITIHSNYWESVVLPFKNIIESYIKNSGMGSLSDHVIDINKINSNKLHFQLAATRGSVKNTKSKDAHWLTPMWESDIYTLCRNDTESIRNKISSNSSLIFEFGNDVELDNFISYIKTNFARFCLSLLKAGQGNSLFEISLIPWMDFKQNWDDQKLYNYLNVPIQTQNYINNFLT